MLGFRSMTEMGVLARSRPTIYRILDDAGSSVRPETTNGQDAKMALWRTVGDRRPVSCEQHCLWFPR